MGAVLVKIMNGNDIYRYLMKEFGSIEVIEEKSDGNWNVVVFKVGDRLMRARYLGRIVEIMEGDV